MTQEEKQLLLKDLCSRLPYGVIVDVSRVEEWKQLTLTPFILSNYYDDIEKIKPYLRPMSSMTDDEKMEWFQMRQNHCNMSGFNEIRERADFTSESSDWLNAHHFDYHIDPLTGKTLIESGLAIETREGMYKID